MNKKIALLLIVLGVLVVILYYPPIPKPSFEEIYREVDPGTRASLVAFRKNFQLQYSNLDGQAWPYLVTGKGDKTILFLHGMTGAYDIWWQQIVALRDDYRIVTLTYPPVHSLEKMEAGVMKILERENIKRVNIVGTSLGGYFAQFLVARHPEMVERAIFANTFPPNPVIEEKNRTLGKLMPFFPEWAVMKFLRMSTENSIYPASGNSNLVKAFLLEQSWGMMSKAMFIARYHCVVDSFQAPDPDALGIRVAIIESDNDPLVEISLRDMLKRTYPTAAVTTLHHVGHFPYLSEPDQYTALIRAFFQ